MKIKDLEKKYKGSLSINYWDRKDLALELGLMITNARIKAGLTQKQLALKIKTKQPSIARIENGSSLASNALLAKVAHALKAKFVLPKFDFKTREKSSAKILSSGWPTL